MNLSQTAQVLAMIQSFDRRTVGETDVVAWQSLLSDADMADAQEAVRRHFAESTDWMMPAHLRKLIRDIVREQRVSKWAPGQHGVLREDAVPEMSGGGRLALEDLPAAVADLVARVRADLPEGSREALFPRTAAWEREQRAFQRSQGGEANPHYRHRSVDDRLRDVCRVEGAHDSGEHAEGCPDAPFVTCQLCGARSQDLAGHHRDYPNGSCV